MDSTTVLTGRAAPAPFPKNRPPATQSGRYGTAVLLRLRYSTKPEGCVPPSRLLGSHAHGHDHAEVAPSVGVAVGSGDAAGRRASNETLNRESDQRAGSPRRGSAGGKGAGRRCRNDDACAAPGSPPGDPLGARHRHSSEAQEPRCPSQPLEREINYNAMYSSTSVKPGRPTTAWSRRSEARRWSTPMRPAGGSEGARRACGRRPTGATKSVLEQELGVHVAVEARAVEADQEVDVATGAGAAMQVATEGRAAARRAVGARSGSSRVRRIVSRLSSTATPAEAGRGPGPPQMVQVFPVRLVSVP